MDTPQTPPYVLGILERNRALWQLSATSPGEFSVQMKSWTKSIAARLKKLRGDKRKAPVLSVVIPACDEEEHILATLESLAAQQEVSSTEVIIVANNCSPTDRTAEIAKACGAQVLEYEFKQEKIKPISYARQQGLVFAKGTLIVTTDADTIAMPHWLHRLSAPLTRTSKIGFTTSHSHLYEKETDPKVEDNDKNRRFIRETFEWTGFIGLGNNMAFRREEAIELGGYNIKIYPGEDTEIGIRLSIFQRKDAKLVTREDAAIWMSPRRVRAFGSDWLFSHMDWQGKILDVRESVKK